MARLSVVLKISRLRPAHIRGTADLTDQPKARLNSAPLSYTSSREIKAKFIISNMEPDDYRPQNLASETDWCYHSGSARVSYSRMWTALTASIALHWPRGVKSCSMWKRGHLQSPPTATDRLWIFSEFGPKTTSQSHNISAVPCGQPSLMSHSTYHQAPQSLLFLHTGSPVLCFCFWCKTSGPSCL